MPEESQLPTGIAEGQRRSRLPPSSQKAQSGWREPKECVELHGTSRDVVRISSVSRFHSHGRRVSQRPREHTDQHGTGWD